MGHELQGHHGPWPTVVTTGSTFSFLLLSHGYGNLGGPVMSQMKVKCHVKMVKNLHT